jgi:hypothetical protein
MERRGGRDDAVIMASTAKQHQMSVRETGRERARRQARYGTQRTGLRFVHGQRWISLAVEASSFLFSVRFVQVDLVAGRVLARLVGEKTKSSRARPLLVLLVRLLLRLSLGLRCWLLREGLLSGRRQTALLVSWSRHGACVWDCSFFISG